MKPFAWIPTLYFAEALPYFAVMTLSTILYTNMGLSNTEQAFYTSWLYLPWVIKPFWSPIVDAFGTKRMWAVLMQLLVGGSLAGVALSLPGELWLRASLAFFWLMAFSSATHDIAADGFYILALDEKEQAFYVGFRSTFYRIGNLFCQGALVVLAGWLEVRYSVPIAWSVTFGLLGGIMILLACWHTLSMPKSSSDCPKKEDVFKSFVVTWRTFMSKPGLLPAILFMLLFRFPEGQLAKMAQPFMLRSMAEGGLGLDTAAIGYIYGTVGVGCLLAGGIVGGMLVSRHGLRSWIWPMVVAISVPDVVYVYLAYFQPTNLFVINSCVALEQLGYGFGFTAYMLFLVAFARGENATSVFSFCTGLQALGMMIPGMMAGWLADTLGFRMFFVWVVACTFVTFAVTAFVRKKL